MDLAGEDAVVIIIKASHMNLEKILRLRRK